MGRLTKRQRILFNKAVFVSESNLAGREILRDLGRDHKSGQSSRKYDQRRKGLKSLWYLNPEKRNLKVSVCKT